MRRGLYILTHTHTHTYTHTHTDGILIDSLDIHARIWERVAEEIEGILCVCVCVCVCVCILNVRR
jgi:hypothetical protein